MSFLLRKLQFCAGASSCPTIRLLLKRPNRIQLAYFSLFHPTSSLPFIFFVSISHSSFAVTGFSLFAGSPSFTCPSCRIGVHVDDLNPDDMPSDQWRAFFHETRVVTVREQPLALINLASVLRGKVLRVAGLCTSILVTRDELAGEWTS
jgi:hypothetical protein